MSSTVDLILADGNTIPAHRWVREHELCQLLSPGAGDPILLIGENNGGEDLKKVLSPHGAQWIWLPSYFSLLKGEHWIGCILSNRDPADHTENCDKHEGGSLWNSKRL